MNKLYALGVGALACIATPAFGQDARRDSALALAQKDGIELLVSASIDHGGAAGLTLSAEPWVYGLAASKHGQFATKNRAELLNTLDILASLRKHSTRQNNDSTYSESGVQLEKLDTVQLRLLASIASCLENDDTIDRLGLLFPHGSFGYETGGYLLDGCKFQVVNTDWQSSLWSPVLSNSSNSYDPPYVHPYVEKIGLFHTHIDRKFDSLTTISGPSDPDLSVLESQEVHNPLSIHIVIDRRYSIEGFPKYNIDAYFYPVSWVKGKPRRAIKPIVYDFGEYSARTEFQYMRPGTEAR